MSYEYIPGKASITSSGFQIAIPTSFAGRPDIISNGFKRIFSKSGDPHIRGDGVGACQLAGTTQFVFISMLKKIIEKYSTKKN